jgi:hypothetical protein
VQVEIRTEAIAVAMREAITPMAMSRPVLLLVLPCSMMIPPDQLRREIKKPPPQFFGARCIARKILDSASPVTEAGGSSALALTLYPA